MFPLIAVCTYYVSYSIEVNYVPYLRLGLNLASKISFQVIMLL